MCAGSTPATPTNKAPGTFLTIKSNTMFWTVLINTIILMSAIVMIVAIIRYYLPDPPKIDPMEVKTGDKIIYLQNDVTRAARVILNYKDIGVMYGITIGKGEEAGKHVRIEHKEVLGLAK